MKFKTEIELKSSDLRIYHSQNLCLMGSCFTDNIGGMLKTHRFNSLVNPFGVLYNPASIEKHLLALLNQVHPNESELFQHQGVYSHFDFHSKFSHPDKEKALGNMKISFNSVNLETLDVLFITWGTSRIYQLKSDNSIVANCHKLPANHFVRSQLSINEIVESYNNLIEGLLSINPKLKIVFTVSPVRHLKDGFIENQRSKARLILAAEALEQIHSAVHYFPAYEIMTDDLRDYRYYAEDMLHPNTFATQYIWEKFSDFFFSQTTVNLNRELLKLHKARHHTLFFPETVESERFANVHLMRCYEIMQSNPEINLDEYVEYFERLI
ncbi:MAG: GSCFA domain-containing protein [Bacteroidota bacterium]|nr:GSCFA domain-containing protein [Bacteroidota bacterium]